MVVDGVWMGNGFDLDIILGLFVYECCLLVVWVLVDDVVSCGV